MISLLGISPVLRSRLTETAEDGDLGFWVSEYLLIFYVSLPLIQVRVIGRWGDREQPILVSPQSLTSFGSRQKPWLGIVNKINDFAQDVVVIG
jgi:hypothetical protein